MCKPDQSGHRQQESGRCGSCLVALPAFGVFLEKRWWGQGGLGEGTGKGEKVKEGRGRTR